MVEMGFYIDVDGIYYEGDKANLADIAVTPRPSAYHIYESDVWTLDREKWLDAEIRPQRDTLLDKADIKYCNAELWSTMSAETKALWTSYKQALRDLPANINYDNPVWPAMPA